MNSRDAEPKMSWPRLPGKNPFRCPKCSSLVYSRKSRYCGVCGIVLPESFQFNSKQTAELQAMLELEREQHKAWMLKRAGRVYHQLGN